MGDCFWRGDVYYGGIFPYIRKFNVVVGWRGFHGYGVYMCGRGLF